MTSDFSGTPDDQMEHIFGLLENNPDFIPNPEERKAFVAEYFRRRRGQRAPQPDNVEDNLRGAATTVTPDPDMTPRAPRGPGPKPSAAAQQAAKPSADMPLGPKTTRTPEGLEVPVAYDDGDTQYYTFGDERRAREAQDAAYAQAGGRTDMHGNEFGSVDEAEKYYTRPRDRAGNLLPSPYDLDRRAAGDEAVFNERGEIVYRRAAPTDGTGGVREDIDPGAARYSNFLLGETADTGETIAPRFQVQTTRGPFGPVNVLVPTQASRDRQALRAQQASADRVAARTGMKPEDLMDPAARGRALSQKYERDMQARNDFRIRRAMLAGGSQNINSGNAAMWNQLAMLPPEEAIRQLTYSLPGGQLRAGVDARQLDQAAQLAQRGIQGALAGTAAGPLGQAQAALAQQQVEQGRPVQERAAARVAAGDTRHPDVRQHAMDIMHNSYSSPGAFGSSFTDNEVELAAQRMTADTGMDIGDSRTLMRELQADRNSGLWSGITGLIFDQ